MNALASDQEKRFAKVIWKTEILRKAGIRVGNYTGRYDPVDPGASQVSGTMMMGEHHGITNHDAQQNEPPDILLTNYKMLDYLLMRPQDQRLWRNNDPGVLQYLILDELHTYDGAREQMLLASCVASKNDLRSRKVLCALLEPVLRWMTEIHQLHQPELPGQMRTIHQSMRDRREPIALPSLPAHCLKKTSTAMR